MIERCSQGDGARGQLRHRRIPGIFLVGAPKSGTTAMSDFLGAHPDIFMARKEMHLFGSDLHFGKHFYRRNREAYLQEFDDWKDQSLGDRKSTRLNSIHGYTSHA